MKNRLKNINLLNDGFYPLSVILMESFWVFPWLLWMEMWPPFAGEGLALSLAAVVLVLVAAVVITRFTIKRDWPLWLIRSVIIGSGVVIIFLVLRIEHPAGFAIGDSGWFSITGTRLASAFSDPHPIVVALPLLVYLWWRGIMLGRTTSLFRDIYTSFIVGMVFLVTLVILWQLNSGIRFDAPTADIGLFIIAFFFFGLVSVTICHLLLMHRSMPREESALTSVWRWLPMMLIVIGGIVGVGFAVATAFSSDFFQIISRAGQYIGAFFQKMLDLLSVPIIWLIEVVAGWIDWIMLQLNPASTTITDIPESGLSIDESTIEGITLAPEAVSAIKVVLVVIFIGLIAFLLTKAVSRYFKRQKDSIEEIHESIWDAQDIRDDIMNFLKSLGNRFRRKPRPAAAAYIFKENPGRLEIRDIYRHLLWEGKRSGMPRHRQETVEEYAARLGERLPEATAPVNGITDMYSGVRYGDVAAPEERVDSANSLWQKLRNLLRGYRGAS